MFRGIECPQRTSSPQACFLSTGGNVLLADYVFELDYKLESIEEHPRMMWHEKHLPALKPGEKNEQGQDIVEYGSRMWGILEELENDHVCIEQLNRRLLRQEEAIEKLTNALGDI